MTRVVTRRSKPYCVCKGRISGYTRRDDGVWVHPSCMKPSKPVWEGLVQRRAEGVGSAS